MAQILLLAVGVFPCNLSNKWRPTISTLLQPWQNTPCMFPRSGSLLWVPLVCKSPHGTWWFWWHSTTTSLRFRPTRLKTRLLWPHPPAWPLLCNSQLHDFWTRFLLALCHSSTWFLRTLASWWILPLVHLPKVPHVPSSELRCSFVLVSVFLYRNARHWLIWYRLGVHNRIWLEKKVVHSFCLLDKSSLLFCDTWWWVRPLPIRQCAHESQNGTCRFVFFPFSWSGFVSWICSHCPICSSFSFFNSFFVCHRILTFFQIVQLLRCSCQLKTRPVSS